MGDLLARGVRPRRASPASATLAFGWRAMLKLRHEPGRLVDVIAIPVVFTVLFTYLFGGALAGSTAGYLTLLLPGTLVMSVTIVTMYGGARLAADVSTGIFDRFRTMSFWRGAFLLGGLLGDVGRYLLSAVVVVSLGLAIGYRPAGGVPGVLAGIGLVVVFALSLSWLWAALALLVRDPATVLSIGSVVLFPLTLASNIFVEPATMPGWLRAFATVNPVSHLATAARALMNNSGNAAGPAGWSLLAAAAVTLACAPVALRLYARRD
jgi:ABC-2 type transport system permease protein